MILCVFPEEIIMMETDIDDLRLLDDLEFLFDEGSMQFGVEEDALQTETFRLQMIDESNSER